MFGKQNSLGVKNTLRVSLASQLNKVEKAKKFPIETVYKGELKRTGRVLMGRCPFHEEKTPSFAIYPDTNTFFCFGCRKSGDVLDLYTKLNGCSFSEAVEELTK